MEDATQPGMASQFPSQTQPFDSQSVATQLETDPRRTGSGTAGMSPEDLADIFCILHPSSPMAYQATLNIAAATLQTTDGDNATGTQLHRPESFELKEGRTSCIIPLRLSAQLKDPLEGYCFGRNPKRCDFVLNHQDDKRRISNVHFKIYVNRYGSIMIEDTSTNGTIIDDTVLRTRYRDDGSKREWRHVLHHGAVISVLQNTETDEHLKFIVRIPFREGEHEDAYSKNVEAHLRFKHALQVERDARTAEGAAKGEIQPAMQPHDESAAPVEISLHAKEWKGGKKYNKINCIGKGAFATVYKVTSKHDGVAYAAKEIEKRRFIKNGIMDIKVETEMKIMRRIKHKHIVEYIEDVNWEGYIYIIMEYIPGGDLGALIAKPTVLPEPTVKTMTLQMLSALQYLHELGITHRDIKPDNILIQTLDPFVVKLTDFGLSKVVEDADTFLRTFCGTLLYCAPEVYSEYREYNLDGVRQHRSKDKSTLPPQKYDSAVDLWSLAGVLFYSLSGSPPYPAPQGTTYRELLHGIMTKALDIRPLQLRNVSESGIRFLKALLKVRPEYRPSIPQLFTSSWLRDESDDEDDEEEEEDYDEDEVDMIGDNNDEKDLEEHASQLSISQAHDSEGDDGEDMFGEAIRPDPFPHIKDRKPREARKEIPSSFIDDDSSVDESFGFMKTAPGNERLFGEVTSSAVGSSGILPAHLNLPQTTFRGVDISTQQDSKGFENDSFGSLPQQHNEIRRGPFVYGTPYHQRTDSNATATPFRPELGWHLPSTAPSLLGAESHLGQLRMESPDPTHSPTRASRQAMIQNTTENQGTGSHIVPDRGYRHAASPPVTSPPALSSTNTSPPAMSHGSMSPPIPPPQTLPGLQGQSMSTNNTNFNSSVRRREDTEEIGEEERVTKRPRSSRRIDFPLPKTTFWDAGDKSTHHNNYPRMTFSEWEVKTREALARGEKKYMPEKRDWLSIQAEEDRIEEERKRQASRDSSYDPGTPSTELGFGDDHSTVRGTSIELAAHGRSPLSREEYISSEDIENTDPARHGSGNIHQTPANNTARKISTTNMIPPTQESRRHTTPSGPIVPSGVRHVPYDQSTPVYGKLSSVPESIIQHIEIPIIDQITTYGRSNDTYFRHDNPWETKIPKHALKLAAWKPNMTSDPWYTHADIKFYIASKFRQGIRINGQYIPVYMTEDIHGFCKHWVEIRDGDFITVWLGDEGAVSLKFECWIGESAKSRGVDPIVFLDESLASELDLWFVGREKKRLADKTKKGAKQATK